MKSAQNIFDYFGCIMYSYHNRLGKIKINERTIHAIFLIFNLQILVIYILAVTSTILCIHFEYEADFPLSLIATSIVFPIVFSIGGAYKRREAALREYAAIKGCLRAIFSDFSLYIKYQLRGEDLSSGECSRTN